MNRKSLFVSLAILIVIITVFSAMAVPVINGDPDISFLFGVVFPGVFISVIGIITLLGIHKNTDREFDERMLKARGDSAVNALVVTLITILCIGFLSFSTDYQLPISLFDASIVCSMTGVGTFIILADMQDAFLGMKEKRKLSAVSFMVAGLFSLISSIIRFKTDPEKDNIVTFFTVGIVWVLIATELFIKIACDKRDEKMEIADEES